MQKAFEDSKCLNLQVYFCKKIAAGHFTRFGHAPTLIAPL
jgi:hypothetical protein